SVLARVSPHGGFDCLHVIDQARVLHILRQQVERGGSVHGQTPVGVNSYLLVDESTGRSASRRASAWSLLAWAIRHAGIHFFDAAFPKYLFHQLAALRHSSRTLPGSTARRWLSRSAFSCLHKASK